MTTVKKQRYSGILHNTVRILSICLIYGSMGVSCIVADDSALKIGSKENRLLLECGPAEQGFPLVSLYDTSSRMNFIRPDYRSGLPNSNMNRE